MARLTVEIVTPEKRILTTEADEIIVPGAEGLFGVRPGHTPYLALMSAGVVTVVGDQAGKWFVTGGFAEVSDDKVMVLADRAEAVADIDVAAAERRLEEAQAQSAGGSAEAELAAERARLERARIAAATSR